MKWKIGIIGDGNVGSALQRGLSRAGYETKAVGRNPQAVRETAQWAEIILLAVPFGAIDAALGEMGSAIDGKPLIDATNALTPDYQLAVGFTTSGAEELQKKAKNAKVVKAFNTVFSSEMDSGQTKGVQLTAFAAGDDAEAKSRTLQLMKDIGFDAIDAGPLKSARMLEPLALLNITLGFTMKMGREIGFKLIH